MIELLGIGVERDGAWRLRRVCARVESRTLAAVLSSRREDRLALLDVLAGRIVPSEGRAWIDGVPLGADTAAKVRERVGVVDLGAPLALTRSVAWNALAVEPRTLRERLGSFGHSPLAEDALPVLARAGLTAEARMLAAGLDADGRARLALARALRGRPDVLVAPEPDAWLSGDEARAFLRVLKGLASSDGLAAFVSLASADLARDADVVVQVAGEVVPA